MNLKVKRLSETAKLPTRGTSGSAGLDLYSDERVIITPGLSEVVRLGVAVEIPRGYFGLLSLRSKLGFRFDCLSHVGIIDSDYIGELKVKVFCEGTDGVLIEVGDKIAQLTLIEYLPLGVIEAQDLTETERGVGGFGSTDKLNTELSEGV